MKSLLLIDANSFIHRAFHAMPPLVGPLGQPTGALFGLANILIRGMENLKPDHVAVAFDRPEPTFRKKMYDAYKATRVKAPDELISQIIESRRLVAALNLPIFECPGFEADDIIGTLAEKFKNDIKIYILTGDLDALQLVEDDKIEVLSPKKGVSELMPYDEKAVLEKIGVLPEKITDYKGLAGDQSDNIPGIPGVGPKTAVAIIQEFGSVEKIFKKIGEAHPLAKKLMAHKDIALISKELATIKKDVPINVELKNLEYRPPTPETIVPYFNSLGFQNLVRRFSAPGAEQKQSLTPEISAPREENENDLIFVDETQLVENPALLSSPKNKIAHDWKNILQKTGNFNLREPYFDLKIAAWLTDPDRKDVSIENLSRRLLKKEYAADDASGIFISLHRLLSKKIKDLDLDLIWQNIEKPLIPILAEIETNGIIVNLEKLKSLKSELERDLKLLTVSIHEEIGEIFNLNSPKQLSDILFNKILVNIKKTKTTKTGQKSTSEEILRELEPLHPVIKKIIEYRESFKILRTYVESLIENSENSHVHTNFIQTGTATGRLSSEKPNLQNIPADSKWAAPVRSVFESSPETTLVSLDYSQLELRVLAHLSGDEELQRAFKENKDVHRLTAAKVFKINESEVTDSTRKIGKTLNFGIIYGMGPRAFSKTGKITFDEARAFISSYFANFPKIKKWQDDVLSHAKIEGLVRNENGRLRFLPNIISGHPRFAAESERVAINLPVQGLSADIMKLAMVKIKNALLPEKIWNKKIKILLTIHDELLLEIADDMLKPLTTQIKRIMENAFHISVPLKVDASAGKNWGAMQKIEL